MCHYDMPNEDLYITTNVHLEHGNICNIQIMQYNTTFTLAYPIIDQDVADNVVEAHCYVKESNWGTS